MARRSPLVPALAAGLGIAGYAAKRRVRSARLRVDPLATDEVWFDLDAVGVEHHRVPTPDGGELHVVEKGPKDARPLLLLHGITLAARVWGYQFRDLSDRYRVVAADLRGFGESRAGADGYGIRQLGNDVATVLEGLDLRDAVVVGHSMGGMATMRFAAEHADVLDERVAGLVFLATAPVVPFHPLVVRSMAPLGPRGNVIASRPGLERFPRANLVQGDTSYAFIRGLVFGRAASPMHVELTRQLVEAAPRSAVVGSALGLHDHLADEGLRSTRTPSFVIGGHADRLTPRHFSRRIADCLPDGELHLLPDAGHMLMLERPVEVAELIDRLVAKVESRASADT